jgi:Thioredoxin-like
MTMTHKVAWTFGKRAAKWLLGGAIILAGTVAPAWAAPTVQQMLQFKPRQDGIAITTPDADKLDACKVELIKGARKGSGWILKDAQGNILRNFFDTNGDDKIDMWSYYKDGKEVYREVDSTFTGKPDQYRWINDGGSKWGIDETKSGKITAWKVISPEEVSQEIVAALIGKDYSRLQVLMITEAEMKALELPASEIERIRKAQKEAPAKFNETLGKLPKLTAKSTWQNLLTNGPPACVPGDLFAGHTDLIRHTKAMIVIDINDKEKSTEMVQVGELIQVGAAWRITGAPAQGVGDNAAGTGPGGTDIGNNPKLEALIKKLSELDAKTYPDSIPAAHHLQRADLVEQIIAEVKETERESWIRQVADSLSSAAQSADKTALTRLVRLVDQVVKAMPGSNLAAYATFRQLQAEYTLKINEPKVEFMKTQTEWVETLSKFVTTYPKGEDTPEAMLQLGMVNEFLNEEVKAKNWYNQLARNFSESKQATKAKGAIKRMEIDGQPFKLVGPTLKDPNAAFDSEALRGKFVIVYYWTSWNSQSVGDFAKLKLVLDGNKDVELLAINVDATLDDARKFLAKSPALGVHLHQDGGLESKLATDYGILLPPYLFLIGKDGKCLSHTSQVNTKEVEDEIKKAEKK